MPSSGPTASQIVDSERREAESLGFHIVDVTSDVVSALNESPAEGLEPLAFLTAPGDVDRIGPGDQLDISIFEVGAALFGEPAASMQINPLSTGASGTRLPVVTVGRDGFVDLPFIGRVRASGLTAEELQASVRQHLKGKSQNAQVLVSVRDNLANTIVVSADAKKPGRQRLTLVRPRLLDAIADAGGPSFASQDTRVRVTRQGQSRQAILSDILPESKSDLTLLPGDRIELLHEPRTFTVFGAALKVAEVPFEHSHVTLAEAVARAGGPSEAQADPTGVFLFRYESKGVAPSPRPIIYRLNMMRPSSYFLAQKFMMRDGDVLYIANARASQALKLIQVLSLVVQPVYTAKVVGQ